MQQEVAKRATKVRAASVHSWGDLSDGARNQTTERPRKIQATGKRWSPPVRKTKAPIMSRIRSRSVRKAVRRLCFCENGANASAAQRARTRWKSGSHRKLQRKTLA